MLPKQRAVIISSFMRNIKSRKYFFDVYELNSFAYCVLNTSPIIRCP